MRQSSKKELLQQYIVESLLAEDDYGLGDSRGEMMGGYGSPSDLYKTFIQPFTDVVKTGMSGVKQLTTRAKTAVWVGLQTVLTTIVPFWSYTYSEVFENQKKRLEKIKSEYSDVFARTNEALSSNDAALLAFMASPAAFMTGKSLKVTKELLNLVSGGVSEDLYDKAKSKLKSTGRWTDDKTFKGPSDLFKDWHLNEEDENLGKKVGPKAIIRNKQFLDKSLSSPHAKKMQKDATAAFKSSFDELVARANSLKNISKLDTLEKGVKTVVSKSPKGVKVPSTSEFDKAIKELKDLKDPKEKKLAEEELINYTKKGVGEFFAQQLQKQLEVDTSAIEAAGGKADDTQYIKDLKATIQKLKSI